MQHLSGTSVRVASHIGLRFDRVGERLARCLDGLGPTRSLHCWMLVELILSRPSRSSRSGRCVGHRLARRLLCGLLGQLLARASRIVWAGSAGDHRQRRATTRDVESLRTRCPTSADTAPWRKETEEVEAIYRHRRS